MKFANVPVQITVKNGQDLFHRGRHVSEFGLVMVLTEVDDFIIRQRSHGAQRESVLTVELTREDLVALLTTTPENRKKIVEALRA